MINDITKVTDMYRQIVPKEMREKFYDVAKNPIITGYNVCTSFRNGGKSTNILLWALCANAIYGSRIAYIRTDKTMTTNAMVSTLFDSINAYVFDDGRNYIQHIYGDKYNCVRYIQREKRFVLACETDKDYKDNPTLCYVRSIDQNDQLRSGFADSMLDIIFYDEMMDKKVNSSTLLHFCHIVSTFFRSRYQSIIFMACNMSTGSPVIFQQMGIYNQVINQKTEYAMYRTKKGTRIAVEVLKVSSEQSNERNKMNENFFGFDVDGMEIIRGSSIIQETYREIPKDTGYTLTDVGLYIYCCGIYVKIYTASIDGWQEMFYAEEVQRMPDHSEVMTLTDDLQYAIDHPFTYANIGKEWQMCMDLARRFRRNDVCFSNYMAYVCLNSFYDYYRVSELL